MLPLVEFLEDTFDCDGSRMFLSGSVYDMDFIFKLEEVVRCQDLTKEISVVELQKLEMILSTALSHVREQLNRND